MKKILRNLWGNVQKFSWEFEEIEKNVLGSCVENLIPERVELYSFCSDVLEMAQNRPQSEVGP